MGVIPEGQGICNSGQLSKTDSSVSRKFLEQMGNGKNGPNVLHFRDWQGAKSTKDPAEDFALSAFEWLEEGLLFDACEPYWRAEG